MCRSSWARMDKSSIGGDTLGHFRDGKCESPPRKVSYLPRLHSQGGTVSLHPEPVGLDLSPVIHTRWLLSEEEDRVRSEGWLCWPWSS